MARFAPTRYALGADDLVTPASFLDRVASRLVDIVVMFCVIGFVQLILVFPFTIPESMGVGSGVAFSYWLGLAVAAASAVILYEVWATSSRGQSLGKRNVGLEVLRIGDGQPPQLLESLARATIPLACGASVFGIAAAMSIRWPLLYGTAAWALVCLSTLLDSSRRGWHDKLAGTIVVKRARVSGRRRAVLARVPGDPRR